MIALGLTCSPLEFCVALKESKQKYSVSEMTKHPIILFPTLNDFVKMRRRNIPRKILIFDTPERLSTVKGLTVLKQKTVNTLLPAVLKETTESTELSLTVRKYIQEIIDSNKDDNTSFIHVYNTNLYNISFLPTRDIIRKFYMAHLSGEITRDQFTREISSYYPKRGKSLIAVDNLVEIMDTDLFKRMQTALQKAQGNKTTKEIEAIANKYEVAPFDLRYFLSSKK